MQTYSTRRLDPIQRAIILLIVRALAVAVVVVVIRSLASAGGMAIPGGYALLAWIVAALILAGRAIAEIDRGEATAAPSIPSPLPEWIAEASELAAPVAAIDAGHAANFELETILSSLHSTQAELTDCRAKLLTVSQWCADTERARQWFEAKLNEYRSACDGLADLLELERNKTIAAKVGETSAVEREAVAIAEWIEAKRDADAVPSLVSAIERRDWTIEQFRQGLDGIAELYETAKTSEAEGRELLRKAVVKNHKLTARVIGLRDRLRGRRERRKAQLDRALVRETAAASLVPVVHSWGGIDHTSHSFQTVYGSRKEAINAGIPGYLLRKKGRALDVLAGELENSGYFQTPAHRHADEYLLELIATRAPSAVFQSHKPFEIQSELEQIGAEEYADDSFNVNELEAVTL